MWQWLTWVNTYIVVTADATTEQLVGSSTSTCVHRMIEAVSASIFASKELICSLGDGSCIGSS